MKRLVCLLRDLMKTLILGGIISIGIAIVIGLIALLVNITFNYRILWIIIISYTYY